MANITAKTSTNAFNKACHKASTHNGRLSEIYEQDISYELGRRGYSFHKILTPTEESLVAAARYFSVSPFTFLKASGKCSMRDEDRDGFSDKELIDELRNRGYEVL